MSGFAVGHSFAHAAQADTVIVECEVVVASGRSACCLPGILATINTCIGQLDLTDNGAVFLCVCCVPCRAHDLHLLSQQEQVVLQHMQVSCSCAVLAEWDGMALQSGVVWFSLL